MITRDEIIRMAREAGFQTGCLYPQSGKGEPTLLVCALGTSCTVEVEKLIRAAYAAGAAAERERIEAERQPHIYSQPLYTSGCPVCGLGANGKATAYVCTRGDCPTRVTCTGAV